MKSKKIKEVLLFALFVFPAVAFVLFATDIPFVMNLYYSVFEWNGIGKSMKFVGLDNFVKIFTNDSLFWKGVTFTLKFAVFYVVIVNVISLVVAMVMSKERKSSSVGRAFYYIPYIISLTAISLIWKFIFGPGFEALYDITGWEFFNWSWVGTPKLAFYVVVIMAVWQNVGFYMVNYIAGIIAVPKELIEAAKIDGASRWQQIKSISLPLLAPTAITLLLLNCGKIMNADFGMFYSMIGNNAQLYSTTDVLDTFIYRNLRLNGDVGMSSAAGLYQSVLSTAILLFMNRLARKHNPDGALF